MKARKERKKDCKRKEGREGKQIGIKGARVEGQGKNGGKNVKGKKRARKGSRVCV